VVDLMTALKQSIANKAAHAKPRTSTSERSSRARKTA